ncbi:hypothetical protein [Oleiagrimonas sp. C23AA]|uniref:hypothetical protein n=1 Tax=Oleiagrimonas sp. C23AA TaxID=2719047 RepID=UPI001422C39E|nr:hypothetical protein [Oleiagrimonas sp. C23AA]NII11302.1 hypothetical protein [Oleiagrimonas sp. C23AA]
MESAEKRMQISKPTIPLILVLTAVLVAFIAIIAAAIRPLTSLENTLLWVIALALSFVGSFYIGKESATSAAREIIRPHARSAFRRLFSLYQSLSRVGIEISKSKDPQSHAITLARMEAIVVEQLATADDALEDWCDIVPDEVEELRSRFASPRDVEVKK